MRSITNLLALALGSLGGFGVVGVASYLVEPATNSSRYQFLFLPVWSFILSVPLLIAAAYCYRRCRAEMSLVEKIVFNLCCLLPLVTFAIAVAVSGRNS